MNDLPVKLCPEGGECRAVPLLMYRAIAIAFTVCLALFLSLAVYLARQQTLHDRGPAGHPLIIERIDQVDARLSKLESE